MLMPTLLTSDLLQYEKIESEEQLWNELSQKPEDLVRFFVCSCDDETWSNQFTEFTTKALDWITQQYFQDKLHPDLAKMAAKVMQEHFSNIQSRLPYNLTCKLIKFGETIHAEKINSFLFQTASPFFHHVIQINSSYKNLDWFIIEGISPQDFKTITEFVYTGEVRDFYKLKQDELQQLMDSAVKCELPRLAEMCETSLKKYISRENVLETLFMSLNNSLDILKQACCDLINTGDVNFVLTSSGPRTLICEIKEINEPTLDALKPILPYITALICGSFVIEDQRFVQIIRECPKVTYLDLGQTRNYNDSLLEIPKHVKEMVLAGCAWLNDQNFIKLVKICPQLETLNLRSCGQITSKAWSELLKLPRLKSLDVTRCMQLTDDEFTIILHSAKGLTELIIGECRRLTENGFQTLSRSNMRLLQLDLNRTELTDAPLNEIGMRLRNITHLNLMRCLNLTEQGIVEMVKIAPALVEVDITRCNVSEAVVEELKKLRPFVNIKGP